MISLSDHKQKKICEKVLQDMKAIRLVLNLTQRGLILFKHYVMVQEIISVIITNITLLDLQVKKYEKELKRIQEDND